MFGLELRRKGNIQNIYSDVTAVLAKAGVEGNQVSLDVQSQSVAHSIQKMLTGSYFSICTIKYCAKLVKLTIPEERLNVYNTQHCVNWSEMLPDYRQILIAMILDDFREVLNPSKEINAIVVTKN